MKKLILLLGIVTILSTGCNSSNNNEIEELKKEIAELKGESEEFDNIEKNTGDDFSDEEIAIESKSKRVSYTVESEYDKGTWGYESDEQKAKTEAIAEQSPSELADYLFLLNAKRELSVPSTTVIDNPHIWPDVERDAELLQIIAAVEHAYLVSDRLSEVQITVNNVHEYEELSARVRSALALEVYVKE